MYKSASFNIFELDLQDIVYGKDPVARTENLSDKKTVVVIGEVTIPKITVPNSNPAIKNNFDQRFNEKLNAK